jgi:hypothetical protein
MTDGRSIKLSFQMTLSRLGSVRQVSHIYFFGWFQGCGTWYWFVLFLFLPNLKNGRRPEADWNFSNSVAPGLGVKSVSHAAASLWSLACSRSRSMSRYLRSPQCVPAMCRSLALTRISALLPSGNAPTTRVRLLISFMILSNGLLVRMLR